MVATCWQLCAFVAELLEELPEPRSYHPTRTAYSFAYGWVEIEPPPDRWEIDEFMECHLERWLGELALLGDRQRLLEVMLEVQLALGRCRDWKERGTSE